MNEDVDSFDYFSFLLLGCSDTGPVSKLPEMNSYDDEQNIILEKFEWLGFPPSIVRTEKISEDLAVIFGYGGNVLVSVGDDGVLIVDSQFPEVYEAIMAEINLGETLLIILLIRIFILITQRVTEHLGCREQR